MLFGRRTAGDLRWTNSPEWVQTPSDLRMREVRGLRGAAARRCEDLRGMRSRHARGPAGIGQDGHTPLKTGEVAGRVSRRIVGVVKGFASGARQGFKGTEDEPKS